MMNVKVKVYDNVKYNPESEKVAEVEYLNIRDMEVKKLKMMKSSQKVLTKQTNTKNTAL